MARGEIFVQLSVDFADDAKVRALARYGKTARLARDLYVQMVLYCRQTLSDGNVPDEQVGILCYPDPPAAGAKQAKQLAEVGLIERRTGGWYVHGFLKRNPSAAQVRADLDAKAEGAIRGNHERWHVKRGVSDTDCPLCIKTGSHPRSGSDRTPDRTSDAGNGASDAENRSQDDHNASVTSAVHLEFTNDDAESDGERDTPGDAPDDTESGNAESSQQVKGGRRHRTPDRTTDRPTDPGSDIGGPSIESPETETETETYKGGSSSTVTNGRAHARKPRPQNPNGTPPPDRCPKHLDDPDPPPCGRCADARRAHTAWQTAEADRKRAAKAADDEQRRRWPRCGRCGIKHEPRGHCAASQEAA